MSSSCRTTQVTKRPSPASPRETHVQCCRAARSALALLKPEQAPFFRGDGLLCSHRTIGTRGRSTHTHGLAGVNRVHGTIRRVNRTLLALPVWRDLLAVAQKGTACVFSVFGSRGGQTQAISAVCFFPAKRKKNSDGPPSRVREAQPA